ncbi:hypothetical protein [Polynucleobacter sp. CS-Odin-A6]|uniref:hypothetical protein n=1 Tax=Polynucleobacter sp. CS-Odin-A6 TaxID=2689106 RepID=UPI001C0E7799|nr:hypothetical protein [Polynucleobacter sp. CS-Odin-A6]MBU3621977.1 hypothetical protein [Polynucleobacter sp. CS-Odin-A6]
MSNKKHKPYLDLIKEIDDGMASIKGSEKKLSKDLKVKLDQLYKIREFLLNEDTYSLLDMGLQHLKDKPFRLEKSSKRESSREKLARLETEWTVAKNIVIKSPHGPIRKYSSDKAIKARKQQLGEELKDQLDKLTLEELKSGFLELLIEREKANQIVAAFQKEITFLSDKLTEKYLKGRISAVKNQTQGVKRRNQKDTDCKRAGLTLLRKNLKSELTGTDFSHYVVVMEDQDLMQNNSKRLTSTEEGWDLATLRNYFAEETKLTPVWSKKLAAEIRSKYPKYTRKNMIEN